jgi:hypothetical protein
MKGETFPDYLRRLGLSDNPQTKKTPEEIKAKTKTIISRLSKLRNKNASV